METWRQNSLPSEMPQSHLRWRPNLRGSGCRGSMITGLEPVFNSKAGLPVAGQGSQASWTSSEVPTFRLGSKPQVCWRLGQLPFGLLERANSVQDKVKLVFVYVAILGFGPSSQSLARAQRLDPIFSSRRPRWHPLAAGLDVGCVSPSAGF